MRPSRFNKPGPRTAHRALIRFEIINKYHCLFLAVFRDFLSYKGYLSGKWRVVRARAVLLGSFVESAVGTSRPIPPVSLVAAGMRFMLLKNTLLPLGLVNGTEGVVVAPLYAEGMHIPHKHDGL
jgi:hypothetical protein